MLDELRRVAAKTADGRGSLRIFEEETGWGRYWFDKYWPTSGYSGACEEAGVQPGAIIGIEKNTRIADEELALRFAKAVSQINGIPPFKRLSAITRMGEATFCRGDGYDDAKRRMIGTYLALPDENRLGHNVDNIMRAELERLNGNSTAGSGPKPPQGKIGFVYLKYSPSLRLYKIGKANDAGKRGAGISLLLPEDLVPKHEIKTDCPHLLEKYWHGRFRAKRRQGEWFDLNRSDVEAFKKRREFMFCEYFP